MKKRDFRLLLLLAAVVLGYIFNSPAKDQDLNGDHQDNKQVTPFTSRTFAKVTRVNDGDTIEIEGGQKLRYIGMDTPELYDPRKPVQCFGTEAKEKNKELVEGKIVKLEKDVSETDKYGRLLRYVWVDNLLVNDYLVKEGYARISTYPPDVKYQSLFSQSEKEARENKRGLWGKCDR